MTTLTAPLPRNPNRFIIAFILAAFLVAAAFGLGFMARSPTLGEVPVKRCSSCATCPCPTLLGGPRCGCPQ
jgi:hypothetical protein